jgi:hypothetical protein
MGHAPDWMRQNMSKVRKFSDGGSSDEGLIPDVSNAPVGVTGGGSSFEAGPAKGFGAGGRLSYKANLDDDKYVELGASGNMSKVKVKDGDFEMKKTQARLTGLDATYVDQKKGYDVGASYKKEMDPTGKPAKTVMITFNKRF